MRKIILGIAIALLVVYSVNYWQHLSAEEKKLTESTSLIEQQIRQVGKLVVTEGTFAQVFKYENSKKLFYLDVLSAKKKALIIINAKVSISYDLRQLTTVLDQEAKTINITHIPEAEITINPDIEYYDVAQDFLNQFNEEDYNTIKKKVNTLIMKKVEQSDLVRNGQNRLISELANIYIVTKSLGWTLKYNNEIVDRQQELDDLIPLKR